MTDTASNVINLGAGNIEQLKRQAEGYGDIFEALADRGPNPRADHIARYVDTLGEEYLEESGPVPFLTRRQAEMADIKSLFNWLYLRLIGQDKKLPTNDAWVMHKDQRGAVPLHPMKVMPWLIEGQFIDPVTGDRFSIVIERLDEEGDQ